MKLRIERSFAKDVDEVRDRKLLGKLRALISNIKEADSVAALPNIKKIEGFDTLYRIRIGDYRVGMELLSGQEVVLMRFLHRKDVYRYFPKRK